MHRLQWARETQAADLQHLQSSLLFIGLPEGRLEETQAWMQKNGGRVWEVAAFKG